MSLFNRPKTISEIEEETEQKEAENKLVDNELSLAQKRVAIAQLKERGLSPKHFPDWDSIIKWLKTH